MAQRLILEISDQTIRVTVAAVVGRRAQISDHFAIPLPVAANPDQMSELLKSALASHRVGRGECDVIVTRRAVEMRELNVPPVPNDELPDLLKFSARNEFASMNDSWRLDYVPLSDDPATARRVLAAAISPQAFDEVNKLLTTAGLKLKRLLLRPFCLATAVDQDDPAASARLLVIVVDQMAELVLVHAGRVFMSRSLLLGGAGPEPQWQELKGEIQRTLIMAGRALPEKEITLVAAGWPASPGQQTEFAASLDRAFKNLSANTNKWVDTAAKCSPLVESGELLPALGALASLSRDQWLGIDFASPRRRVEKKRNWRQIAVWAGLAAGLLLCIFALAWMMLADQKKSIERLQSQLNTLRQANETQGNRPGVDQIVGEVAEIDNWQRGQIDWIEELNELSKRLNTADETMVDSMSADFRQDDVVVVLKGHVQNVGVGADLKSNLVKRPYTLTEGPTREDTKSQDYPWSYEYTLRRTLDGVDVATQINDRIRELRDASTADSGTQSPPATETSPTTPSAPPKADEGKPSS